MWAPCPGRSTVSVICCRGGGEGGGGGPGICFLPPPVSCPACYRAWWGSWSAGWCQQAGLTLILLWHCWWEHRASTDWAVDSSGASIEYCIIYTVPLADKSFSRVSFQGEGVFYTLILDFHGQYKAMSRYCTYFKNNDSLPIHTQLKIAYSYLLSHWPTTLNILSLIYAFK